MTIYRLETMTLTQHRANSLKVYQRTMERSVLGISLRDKVRNNIIRSKIGVVDVVGQVATMKWRWADHVARCKDERWNKRLLCWRPRALTRSVGWPQSRWHDDIRRHAGSNWMRVTRERETWRKMEEACVQECKKLRRRRKERGKGMSSLHVHTIIYVTSTILKYSVT